MSGIELRHLISGAQRYEWQGRVDAARDDEVHVGRQVLEQESDYLVDALGIDHVVVIENYADLSRKIGEFIDEGAKHRFHPRRLGRAKRGKDTFAELLPYGPPKRSNEIRQEPDRIVVSFIQR